MGGDIKAARLRVSGRTSDYIRKGRRSAFLSQFVPLVTTSHKGRGVAGPSWQECLELAVSGSMRREAFPVSEASARPGDGFNLGWALNSAAPASRRNSHDLVEAGFGAA